MKTEKGNLLLETRGLIVHGCNAQGVMGSGIANLLHAKYPQVYNDYIYRHHSIGLKLGDVIFTKLTHRLHVASVITQEYYGRDHDTVYVNYDAVRNGFALVNRYSKMFHLEIKHPLIGAGLANGDWNIIKKIIDEECNKETTLFVYKENKES